MILQKASGQKFYNTSPFDCDALLNDADNIGANLIAYLHGFSPNVQDIMKRFRFEAQIERLQSSKLLFLVTKKFVLVDLHPDRVTNLEMGYIFEELIRKPS